MYIYTCVSVFLYVYCRVNTHVVVGRLQYVFNNIVFFSTAMYTALVFRLVAVLLFLCIVCDSPFCFHILYAQCSLLLTTVCTV